MAKAKPNKVQHYIPRCYLSAWTDPNTPKEQAPYVWVFPKGETKGRRKAPYNIFAETDMYTITKADGERDLRIEKGLSQLEGWFTVIRDNILEPRKDLSPVDNMQLVAFISALKSRTKSFRDHQRKQWGHILAVAEDMKSQLDKISPEEKRKMVMPRISEDKEEKGMSIDDVRTIVKEPVQVMLASMLKVTVPIMAKMQKLVFCTQSSPGFITSDMPVVWFDPKAYKRKPSIFNSSVGIGNRDIEITMPISPTKLILMVHTQDGKNGTLEYIDVPDEEVNEFNRRTQFYSSEEFIVSKDATNPIWFARGTPPKG